jgi:hypothetical protein
MNLHLQPATTHAHYGFLQDETLHTPFFSQNLPMKTAIFSPTNFPFFPCILTLTFTNVDCTQPPCSHNYGM